MQETYTKQLKTNVSKNLANSTYSINKRNPDEILFSNKQIMFEQYKLLIDSAHKIEERRSGSNSVFLGINTLLSSFLVRPTQLSNVQTKDILILILLILIGIFISWDWLKVLNSYKKLNFVNFLLIQDMEKSLPTKVFSLRAELEANDKSQINENDKGNIILIKENFLPNMFILFYCIYLFTIIIYCF